MKIRWGIIIYLLTLSIFGCFRSFAQNGTLSHLYSRTSCGLNYTQSSVVLGQRMDFFGLPYVGESQPASFSISGISDSAVIEQAYLWFDLAGNVDNVELNITSPSDLSNNINATLIGTGADRCWGSSGTRTFRCDVTAFIEGNGEYKIEGFPVDETMVNGDTDGATLFIVYSDPFASYIGTVHIDDGMKLSLLDTVTHTITGINSTSLNTDAKGFMIVSDLQDQMGTTVKINNGAFSSIVEDFWDFEERSTAVTNGQTTSAFGLRSPNDCANLISVGLYYQVPKSVFTPNITNAGDTVESVDVQANYQWAFNDVFISESNQNEHVAILPGDYALYVKDDDGCFQTSNTININCIQSYIPEIYANDTSLYTGDFYNSYTWFVNSVPSIEYTGNFVKNTDTAYYYVQIIDSLGCFYQSDSIFRNGLVSVKTIFSESNELGFFPNPTEGIIRLNNAFYTPIQIYDTKGRLVLCVLPIKRYLDLTPLEPGVYYLSQENEGVVSRNKLLIVR